MKGMKIITLIENTPGYPGCLYEHGLSFYIETDRHRLLLDTGATGAFLQNAETLGIGLHSVDTLVLSHGHYDHGGGILTFARTVPTAKVYLRRNALEPYYHLKPEGEKYIGLDPAVAELPQCIFVDGDLVIDEELSLFTHIRGRRFSPKGNRKLKQKAGGTFVQDEFDHEQCLVVRQGDFQVLLSGCAHNGILNILDRYQELYGRYPDLLVSGFHMKQDAYTEEDLENIRITARILKETGIRCWTGHCTGERAFSIMKEIMGEQLKALHSGEEIL